MPASPLRLTLRILPAALAVGLGLAASPAVAQPGGRGTPGGPGGAGGPPNGFALNDVAATYSFSSDSDLERNGKVGSVEVNHFKFEASFALPAPDTWRLGTSLFWSRDEFELTGPVPLPEDVEAVGLSFLATKDLSREIGPGWSAMALVTPGFASDAGKVNGDSFNLFALATLGREVSPTFSWSFGVIGRTRADTPVLPVLGLDWRFAPDWKLTVGFPRTGVAYQFTSRLSLTAGVTVQGGTYHIAKAPAPGLTDTYLDYREIRAGVGAAYQITPRLSLVLDGGVTVDRNFDYYDRGVELDGKSAGFGRLNLRYRF